jgi:hypothetical protein
LLFLVSNKLMGSSWRGIIVGSGEGEGVWPGLHWWSVSLPLCNLNCKAEVLRCSRHKNHLLEMQIPEFYQRNFYFSGFTAAPQRLCF